MYKNRKMKKYLKRLYNWFMTTIRKAFSTGQGYLSLPDYYTRDKESQNVLFI